MINAIKILDNDLVKRGGYIPVALNCKCCTSDN